MQVGRSGLHWQRGINISAIRAFLIGRDTMQGAYLGPAFGQDEIEKRLSSVGRACFAC